MTSETQSLRQVYPLLFNISTSTIKACIPPHNKIIHTVAEEVYEQPKQLTTHLTLNTYICVKEAFKIGAAF
jgi:hypothetical protein